METKSLVLWIPVSRFNLHVPQTLKRHTQKTTKSVQTVQIFAIKAFKKISPKLTARVQNRYDGSNTELDVPLKLGLDHGDLIKLD